jgi:hypothetical protein
MTKKVGDIFRISLHNALLAPMGFKSGYEGKGVLMEAWSPTTVPRVVC